MASIRKRNGSYLIVVSMGYDYDGNRRKPRQKTVRPPEGLTPKQLEKWLNEQAVLFERECKDTPQTVDKSITLEAYINIWLRDIAPNKLARSTVVREKQDIDRLLPYLGRYKLTELRPEHFRKFYAELRKTPNQFTGKPLSECTIEGVHACLCGILSDAMEGGFLDHNPAWRTYRYVGKKKEKKIADEETTQKLIAALENESIKYETYFKLIIATGMRRGECCGLKWGDINYQEHTIHIQRNVVKVTGEEIIVKEPKTAAGDRYVYFSPEMGSLLKEYRKECDWEAEAYENRTLTEDDYVFRRHGLQLPMTPNSFTWRMKLILKKNGLPEKLNVHSLRHTNASLLIANGTDVATVAGLLGHSQPSTTLDIYTHITDDMRLTAAANIDRGIGKAAPQEDASEPGRETAPATAEKPKMTDFKPYVGRKRRSGTGCVTEINDHLFEGRYSPKWPDGKKHARNVYAHTREECEEKLKVLIIEMKTELAELKKQRAEGTR